MSPVAGLERHCAGRGGTEVVSDARVPPSKTPSPRGPSTRFLVLLVKHPSPAPRTNLDPLRDSTAPGVGAGLARVFIRLLVSIHLFLFCLWLLGVEIGWGLRHVPQARSLLLSTHLRISLTGGRSQLAASLPH